MKIKFWFLIPFLSLIILAVSCADDPNSVGNALIPNDDRLNSEKMDSHTDSFDQSFSSFRKDSSFYSSSNRILLGSYKNISSEVLLSFYISLPDSIGDPLEEDEIELTSSWIEMYPSYWIGDSTNYSFTAHQIKEHWSSIQLDEDTLSAIKSTLGDNILENFEYSPGDTVIKFAVDQLLVKDWVYRSIDDSYPENNGILLAPVFNSGMAGFQALTTYPIYSYPLLHLVFNKNGEFIDTVKAEPKLDIHIPTGERLLPDPVNSVLLQGSINVRGNLKIDLESVPKDILINSAILELYMDEANSFEGTKLSDTLAVSFYVNSELDSVNTTFGKYPLVKNDGIFKGEIVQFVQRWIDGEPNEGMQVKLSDENRNIAAISIYDSSHPDELLRPRLTIYYTKK